MSDTHKWPSCTRMLQLQSVRPSGASCPAPASAFWASLQHPIPPEQPFPRFVSLSQRHTATWIPSACFFALLSAGFARCGCIAGAWRVAVFLCPQPSLRLYSKLKPQSYPAVSLSRAAPCSALLSRSLSRFNALSEFHLCACRSFSLRCVLPMLVLPHPR
jgi:hypothetical protein